MIQIIVIYLIGMVSGYGIAKDECQRAKYEIQETNESCEILDESHHDCDGDMLNPSRVQLLD